MNGDTDQAEAQEEVAQDPVGEWLDPALLPHYREAARRAAQHRSALRAQCLHMIQRIERDVVWPLDLGREIYTNPMTNGGMNFDEAIHRVRGDQEVLEVFASLAASRRRAAEREAVASIARLFEGVRSIRAPWRKTPIRKPQGS